MTDEVERVRNVYDRYARDPAKGRRWNVTRPGNRAMLSERDRAVARILRRNGVPRSGRILDVGCGDGSLLASLERRGVLLAGIEIAEDRATAARRNVPRAAIAIADGRAIPFVDGAFDLSLAFTVFSSVLDDGVASALASELLRVTASRGSILLYDFRYPSRNENTRPMDAGAFRSLFDADVADVATLTLVPPLARALGPLARVLYRPLAAVPFLRTHQLVLIRKR